MAKAKLDYLDPVEAAEFLGVSPRTMETWRRVRSGPTFFKIGHLVRYKTSDLRAWLEAHRRVAKAA
jgi:predicted DNA-binding transcriptional regulator AlpA